jgi:hypothetical protein
MRRITLRLIGAGLVVFAFAVAACGDDDSAGDVAEAAPSAEAPTTTGTEMVVCQVPEPTPIAVGDSVEGQIDGFDQCFVVDVPPGGTRLTITLTGLSDEINLVVGYNDPDTILFRTGDVWSSSEPGTADEQVTIEGPQGGTYFVDVAVGTVRNVSPFTLTVTAG